MDRVADDITEALCAEGLEYPIGPLAPGERLSGHLPHWPTDTGRSFSCDYSFHLEMTMSTTLWESK